MNNVFVYCELEGTTIADVSLELLTKGRKLANQLNCQLEAIVAGSGLEGIEKQVMPYGELTVSSISRLKMLSSSRSYPMSSRILSVNPR